MREYTKLCDVCDFQGGSQPPKDEWSFDLKAGYIRMLQIRDFTQSERVVPKYIKITKTTKTCEADDILIARYGASLGKILTGLAGAYNVAIMKAIPDTNMLEKKYLYYYLKSPIFQGFLLNVGSRAAQAGFNKNDLQDLLIPNITRNEQVEIVGILERVETVIEIRQKELQKLDNLLKARFVEMFGDPIRNTQKRPITELINVVKMQRGFDLPVQERQQDGEIPVFGSNGALDHHNVAKVKGGGVITGRSGTIGNVYYTEGDYWPLNTSLFSVDTHGNNIVYLAYLLTMYDLSRFTEGTGVPTLNRNKFHDKPIIDVSLVEQKKFADFVQQVDKSKFLCFHQKKIRETFKVSRKLIFLLKFYSACRLWCEIIQYTVDTSNFMSNTLSNMNHNFMWNFSNSFCHNVNRAYCTNNTAPFKSTFTIFNTSRLSYFFRKYFNHLFRFTLTK